jgi:hypothetical protein
LRHPSVSFETNHPTETKEKDEKEKENSHHSHRQEVESSGKDIAVLVQRRYSAVQDISHGER